MWTWFSERKPAAEAAADKHEDNEIEVEVERDLTCSELVETAASMPWEDWATFILMSRNHNIDFMTKESVQALFAQYKQCAVKDIAPEPCSPRQLAEFLYLLTPPRWILFQQFTASTNINAMSFTNMLVAFFMFEATATNRPQ